MSGVQAKEVGSLREETAQAVELKAEVVRLRGAQQTSKLSAGRVEELEQQVAELSARVEEERKEKERVSADKEHIRKETDEVTSL